MGAITGGGDSLEGLDHPKNSEHFKQGFVIQIAAPQIVPTPVPNHPRDWVSDTSDGRKKILSIFLTTWVDFWRKKVKVDLWVLCSGNQSKNRKPWLYTNRDYAFESCNEIGWIS